MLTIEKNKPLYEAVQLTQKRAQERQAAAMPQGAPETMPGLAMPGMGAEAPAQGPSGPPNIQDLLSRLGGGQPAGASQLPPITISSPHIREKTINGNIPKPNRFK
jgi:hypothetical protein